VAEAVVLQKKASCRTVYCRAKRRGDRVGEDLIWWLKGLVIGSLVIGNVREQDVALLLSP
jgi:hypothetical protein